VGAAEAFPSVAGHPGVYDGAAFERLHSSTGPTGGALQRRDGRVPASAAVIHCAGSRSEKGRDYCSRVCCGAALKHALALAAKRPGAPVFEVVSDWCLGGEGLERLRREAEAGGRIEFVRAAGPSSVGVESGGDRIVVSCRTAAGTDRRLEVDLVVLETAMAPPAGLPELAARFPLALGESGFLQVSHAKVDPVSTAVRGIQVAGCARGPSDIPEAVAQGAAAAGKILSMLVPGETIALEPRASRIDDRLCAGCRTCVSVCPFGAIRFDPGRGVCAVEEALCLGCGSCAASCPSGAADLKDCTLGEVLAEIEGLASAEL
jgi:heterodisulfide reductase subunit A